MNGLTAIFSAVRAGKELTNASTWKHRQAATTAIVSLVAAGFAIAKFLGLDVSVSDGDIQTAAAGIVAVHGMVSVVLTYATSAKVGLPSQAEAGGGENGPDGPDYSQGGP